MTIIIGLLSFKRARKKKKQPRQAIKSVAFLKRSIMNTITQAHIHRMWTACAYLNASGASNNICVQVGPRLKKNQTLLKHFHMSKYTHTLS